ncbi:hypothetical protein, conserved [Leishmania tarentolae]|uniref:Uncharacterized protein n=1 Tax=Leishmania tarentolae TaxID=5689 RepID=A0A640KPS3_LEITA|nr:hypothetical protein, conserved [Leishmania tarentolae]
MTRSKRMKGDTYWPSGGGSCVPCFSWTIMPLRCFLFVCLPGGHYLTVSPPCCFLSLLYLSALVQWRLSCRQHLLRYCFCALSPAEGTPSLRFFSALFARTQPRLDSWQLCRHKAQTIDINSHRSASPRFAMLSAESPVCHCCASHRRRLAPQPSRPPCCCRGRCTCTHYHCNGPTAAPQPHPAQNSSQGAWNSGAPHGSRANHMDTTTHIDPHSFRRCPVCLPEQAELQEADLLALQHRCEEARIAARRWRSALTHATGPRGDHGGGRNSYQSNTAELLRRQRNSFYQRAVNDEYMARRRMLQAELNARHNGIVKLQRAREALRMEAAFSDAREARRRSCGPRTCSLERSRSTDPGADARLCIQPLQRNDQPPVLESHRESSDHAVSPSTQPKSEYPAPLLQVEKRSPSQPPTNTDPAASPPRQHRERVCNHEHAPLATCCTDFHHCSVPGQWHRGWIWCPFSACHGHHPSQSTRNHGQLPPAPPECQLSRPSQEVKPIFRKTSPASRGGVTCGDAKPERSLKYVEGDAPADASTKPLQPSSAVSAANAVQGAPCRQGKGSSEGARGGFSRFRSHSASSVSLTAPRFGRKVFITDDVYCARRARYMAEWEVSGTVQRVPASSRSPSAPLPEKTPKWRATGSVVCTE